MSITASENFGPRATEIFADVPPPVIAGWVIGSLCWIVVVVLFYLHAKRLNFNVAFTVQVLYNNIAWLPIVYATNALLSLFFVRAAFVFEFIRSLWLAYTLKQFQNLIVQFMGVDTKVVAERLGKEEPDFLFSQFPLIMFRLCDSPRPMSLRMLQWCVFGCTQFIIVVGVYGYLNLWFRIENTFDDTAFTYLNYVYTVSSLCTMYSLNIILAAAKNILSTYRPSFKVS